MKITETICKTALSRSGLPGLDYAINPYRGCSHACIYCYAPAIIRDARKWGEFVDVKINIADVLAKELKKAKRGVIGIGTVTDPYQDAERRYEATRKCLVAILRHDFPVCIQTKSALIVRDIDIIERFGWREVGFTFTTLDDNERRKYEGGSSVDQRLGAIREIKERGIAAWAFIGPILPGITDKEDAIPLLVKKLKDAGADYILYDQLRLKPGTWENIKHFIEKEHPELLVLFEQTFRKGGKGLYYQRVFSEIEKACRDENVPLKKAFAGTAPKLRQAKITSL